MVRGYRTFGEFQKAGEGIATNILVARLKNLEANGILTSEKNPQDRRTVHYRLTEKGLDLAPALLEMLIWGAPRRCQRLVRRDNVSRKKSRLDPPRSAQAMAGPRHHTHFAEVRRTRIWPKS